MGRGRTNVDSNRGPILSGYNPRPGKVRWDRIT